MTIISFGVSVFGLGFLVFLFLVSAKDFNFGAFLVTIWRSYSHSMKTFERLVVDILFLLFKSSLDPQQFAQVPQNGVNNTTVYMLHHTYTHLERQEELRRSRFFFFFCQHYILHAASLSYEDTVNYAVGHLIGVTDNRLPDWMSTVCKPSVWRIWLHVVQYSSSAGVQCI